jgi:tRNA threonylcarbamoyladenosine biosynthesis protein TsaE
MGRFLSRSALETECWAEQLAPLLRPGMRIALKGDLGAGKTTVVRGICRALGHEGEVHSPTYALVHEYDTQPKLLHLDLYRLDSLQDLGDLGLEWADLQEAVLLVEWSERLENQAWSWDVILELVAPHAHACLADEELNTDSLRWLEWRWC